MYSSRGRSMATSYSVLQVKATVYVQYVMSVLYTPYTEANLISV